MGTRTFTRAPATLPLYVRAALPAIPFVGSLPGIRHAGTDVPDLTLVREAVTTQPSHLERYNELCGFASTGLLPPTYPHLPAFALHLALMTDPRFPFAPMGLVHVRNTIVQHRPLTVDDVFDVVVRPRDLRPHPRGRLVDIATTVRVDDVTVWEEVTTLLARGTEGAAEPTPSVLDGVEAPPGVVHWTADAGVGRRYGAVSGDRNPIHLHPLTAKAFGYPRPIAHGMWTLARSLSALQNRLPGAFRVDVEFTKPIRLPSTVVFGSRVSRVTTFGVTGTTPGVTHLVGRLASLESPSSLS